VAEAGLVVDYQDGSRAHSPLGTGR
jgi:hypothetical protein